MLVIADDLTGAADCGVACASHGLHTLLVLGDSGDDVDAEALAVDGDTRRLTAPEAGAETARLLRKYLRDKQTLIYKKLDSTMRGNVGAELAAMLEVRRGRAGDGEGIVAVLAPAFPATGRTTVDGHQLVNGGRLAGSDGGRGGEQLERSDIGGLLRAAQLRPALLALALIRGEGEKLRDAIRAMAQEADVLVCDAESDDDLRRVAEAAMALGRGTMWAGSGGLAQHLLAAAGLPRTLRASHRPIQVSGPALFVVGSGCAVSHEQVEALASRSDTIVRKISAEVLLGGEESAAWRACGLELERALMAGRDVAVMVDPEIRLESAQGAALTTAMGVMVRPLAGKVGALVVTGGETARAVFEAWGVRRLRLMGEVEAGLPFSVTDGWGREIAVVTKAGAFGGRESLLGCLEFLDGLKRGPANEETRSKGPR
jgi:4-hydroxythreonine-4-phosphate dehydrogenase